MTLLEFMSDSPMLSFLIFIVLVCLIENLAKIIKGDE